MQLQVNGYQEIYNTAEYTARKFFSFYRSLFTATSYHAKDLIQESHLKVVETIHKYSNKDYDDVYKLCNQSVGWRLRDIYRKAKKELRNYDNPIKCQYCEEKFYNIQDANNHEREEHEIDDLILEETHLPLHYNDNIIQQSDLALGKGFVSPIKLEELMNFLKPEEYLVVCKVIKDDETYEDIGNQLNYSRQYVEKIYRKSLVKIKKFLKRSGYNG